MLVVGERVIAAMRRYSGKNDFRSNVHCGGHAEKVKLSANNTRLKEMNSPWHDVKPLEDLWYTTFEDLHGVIVANWDVFKDAFHTQTGAVGRLTELEIPRNTIAHNRTLQTSEVERLKLFARDILKCIATSKTSNP